MLSIILSILKITGIVLLILLGILLGLILIILFVPLKYQIVIKKDEKDDHIPVYVKCKFSWLCQIVRAGISYPKEKTMKFKVMFFTIMEIPSQKKNEPKTESKKKSKHKTDANETTLSSNTNSQDTRECSQEPVEVPLEESILHSNHSTSTECEFEKDFMGPEKSQKWPNPFHKLKELYLKITKNIHRIYQLILNKIKGILQFLADRKKTTEDKIEQIRSKIDYYTKLMEKPYVKRGYQLIRQELLHLFKHISPRKFKGEVLIGMEDPATTGQILAITGILYPFIGQNIRVIGDFDNVVCKIDFIIKGKIRVFTLLYIVIKVYFNKDIKRIIKHIKGGK